MARSGPPRCNDLMNTDRHRVRPNRSRRRSAKVIQFHARRCLLAAVGALALSPIAGTLLIDRCPIDVRFPDASMTINQWGAHPRTPQILLLGSSRTGCAVSVDRVTPLVRKVSGDDTVEVFSAAVPGGEPLTMDFLASRLFTEHRIPRMVIVEIAPDTVGQYNSWLDGAIVRQFTIGDVITNFGGFFHSTPKARWHLCSSRLIPFYFHRNEWRTWARRKMEPSENNPANATVDSLAFQPVRWPERKIADLTDADRAERLEGGLRRTRKALAGYKVSGRTPEAMEHLIAICREREIAIILVQMPVHSAQRALFSPAISQRYRDFVAHLTSTYECRYIDLSGRTPDLLLLDCSHSSSEGEEYFSRLFAEEILGPAWRASAQAPRE